MSENTQILLCIWAFWIAVVGLDIFVLLWLRRLRLPEVATVLWVTWIVIAPVIGAVSFLIVRARPVAATRGFDVVQR